MKKQPLLVDLDLDFLWDADCSYGSQGVRVAYPAEIIGNRLTALMKRSTRVHLVTDHHESLYVWDKLKIKKACCVHIDAHHDMWSTWTMHDNSNMRYQRQHIGCGNYLAQAVIDRIVSEIIYVAPKYKDVCSEEISIKSEFGTLKNITVMKWAQFSRTLHRLSKIDVLTIAISPEWSPKCFWPHMSKVCEILGVSKKSLEHRKEQAEDKWKVGRIGYGMSIESLDFRFPYKSTVKSKSRVKVKE